MEETQLKVESLNKQAYKRLKEAILNNTLKPGDRIVESKIADKLGISRTPVRDAINILQNEGLIVSKNGSGNYVLEVTKKDVNEIYDIRKLIESYAIKKIIHTISEKQIKELVNILERFEESFGKNVKDDFINDNIKKIFINVDEQFHAKIISYTNNKRLKKYFKNITEQMKVFRHLSFEYKERMEYAMKYHYKLLEAMRKRDLDLALELLNEHIESGRKEALIDLKKA